MNDEERPIEKALNLARAAVRDIGAINHRSILEQEQFDLAMGFLALYNSTRRDPYIGEVEMRVIEKKQKLQFEVSSDPVKSGGGIHTTLTLSHVSNSNRINTNGMNLMCYDESQLSSPSVGDTLHVRIYKEEK